MSIKNIRQKNIEQKKKEIQDAYCVLNDTSTKKNEYMEKLVLNGVVLDERQAKLDTLFYVKGKCGIIAIYEPYEKYKYKLLILF